MDIQYAQLREKKGQFKYRLWRRSKEVVQAIQTYFASPQSVLDLGTAEGRMMEVVKGRFPGALCIGVDLSWPLLSYGKQVAYSSDVRFIQADIQDLTFLRSNTFNVIIAAAVIEHLEFPRRLLLDSLRILRKEGLMIITTPHPIWEKIAGRLQLIKGEHKSVMSLKKLKSLAVSTGFRIIKEKGFMISPSGFPGEAFIEGIVRKIGAGRYMPNQLLILKKDISE
jgi:ubiquinone/menaquinone biosynthesis C-methylase UbiE